MKNIFTNKKVFHDFFVSDCVEAGISLKGCEIKSIRQGGISLDGSYVELKNGEAFLKNCYVKPYQIDSKTESRATHKLLLHKVEIAKLKRKVQEKGYTVMPTRVYLNHGLVKIEIALCKGKKLYDKRQDLKDKALKRDIDQALKNFK